MTGSIACFASHVAGATLPLQIVKQSSAGDRSQQQARLNCVPFSENTHLKLSVHDAAYALLAHAAHNCAMKSGS
jgi:hypothetical protein